MTSQGDVVEIGRLRGKTSWKIGDFKGRRRRGRFHGRRRGKWVTRPEDVAEDARLRGKTSWKMADFEGKRRGRWETSRKREDFAENGRLRWRRTTSWKMEGVESHCEIVEECILSKLKNPSKTNRSNSRRRSSHIRITT